MSGTENLVGLDETLMQINNQRYWLYAAVNPIRTTFYNQFIQTLPMLG